MHFIRDTVCSVGFIPRYLPFVTSNSSIQYFRHALALDERRAKFMPNYHRSWVHDEDPSSAEEGAVSPTTPNESESKKQKKNTRGRQRTSQEQLEESINRSTGRKTDSLEVWFAGAHAGQHQRVYLLRVSLTFTNRRRRRRSEERCS
jgi:uncharacterized protein (DUF2235 family)